jgi:ATP-dependent Lon protease
MNPVILLDEVDKIPKSEQGKELIGILTHMLDSTQNSYFQDKYFAGIHIDLSKVIFILSYNNPNLIDRILIDRIQQIKFKHLKTSEKIKISQDFFLPQLLKAYKLENKIYFSEEILKFIIETYTYESGCRKLKEILNDIIGQICYEVLENNIEKEKEKEKEKENKSDILEITISSLSEKYLKNYISFQKKNTHETPTIGKINCLYANDLGKGGILPSTAKFFPSKNILEIKVTGLLDDMMKESVDVAKTLAWDITSAENKEAYLKNPSGIHIHCGEGSGSVSKSGTSAGIALTLLIYSLLNNFEIPNNMAVTGEASLDGSVTEIGALENKIEGAIQSGINKIFLTFNPFNCFNDGKYL